MKNIELINAGAGSGKTYKLTHRIIELIENDTPPESIMATTFTIKAAFELRERIRFNLIEQGRVQEAYRIQDGFIGTVNSLCARLLGEYAIDAGMSPAVDTMAEEDGERVFRMAIDKVIKEYEDRMEGPAKRMGLVGIKTPYQSSDDWRDHVKTVVDLARSNQISAERLQEFAEDSWEEFQIILGDSTEEVSENDLYGAVTHAIDILESAGSLTKTTEKSLEILMESKGKFQRKSVVWRDWARLFTLKHAKDGEDAISPVKSIAGKVLSNPMLKADIKQMIEGTYECAARGLKNYEEYKRKNGLMDFIDQEANVLELASRNEAFKKSVGERLKVLLVDEFQDTSPIQLALFLKLHDLIGHSIWVGDPKQSIYGFRGTDPRLMEQFVSVMDSSRILGYSWRSKEILVGFTNALFTRVFSDMGNNKVELKIPPQRTEEAGGGSIETWLINEKNNAGENLGIANGVYDLLERKKDIAPGDIAVLCRTNRKCADIAACMRQRGIRVSIGEGSLLETRECILAISALRYMQNPEDMQAAAQIARLSRKCPFHKDWLHRMVKDPDKCRETWGEDPFFMQLEEGSKRVKYWTPLEALEQAIDRADIIETTKSWENNFLVQDNLDKLRGVCREYIDQCRSQRTAATIEGFIKYVKNADIKKEGISRGNAVNILTYHGAKGLEWPHVILTELNTEPKINYFGVGVEPAEEFDHRKPLANRTISYRPWPFGMGNFTPLNDVVEKMPVAKRIRSQAYKESNRLLYVGMTRARDGLVLAVRGESGSDGSKLKDDWLESLKDSEGERIITLSTQTGTRNIKVGEETVSTKVFEYDGNYDEDALIGAEEKDYSPVYPTTVEKYPKARISPSSLPDSFYSSEESSWDILERFDSGITIPPGSDMEILGNAIHAYLGVEYESMEEKEKIAMAQNIFKRWDVNSQIDPVETVKAAEELASFVNRTYPGAKVFKEWPVVLRTETNRIMQGWIDMLVETDEGFVIIDHKSYPGKDALERAKKHAPQLLAYKEAVEKATGKKAKELLIHLPVSSMIIRYIRK